MKIRMGFVSNSSSTSFVIVGRELTHGNAWREAEELISKGRLYSEGPWCCEGVDFFKVTKEMWDAYYMSMTDKHFTFYDVQVIGEEYSSIKKSDIEGDEFEVHTIDRDNHYTDSIETFKSRYIDED